MPQKQSLGKAYRNDWIMSSTSSKGTVKDPLNRQNNLERRYFSDRQISEIYAVNGMFANLVDIPAEDATREWIEIENVEQELAEQILNKLSNLGAQNVFQEAFKFERLRGDGLVSVGASQQGPWDISDPIDVKRLKDVAYLHPFSGQKLVNYLREDDVFSPGYGEIEYYEISDSRGTHLVHSSRLLHLVTRQIEDEIRGVPLLEKVYDLLLVFDNALWSTGQMMYSMSHKRLKTDGVDFNDKDLRQRMQNELEFEFNTLSLAIIGKEDDLEYIGPKISIPLKDMYDFCWEMLSCVSRMPKSHITGQPQGTVTGAQFDTLLYYMRIAGMQESYLRAQLEYVIDLNFWASDSGVGNGSIDPGKVPYQMKFRPLWRVDDKTDAEIRKIAADIDNIYMTHDVISPQEVRAHRFGDGTSLAAKLDMAEDELVKMAKDVHEARMAAEQGR